MAVASTLKGMHSPGLAPLGCAWNPCRWLSTVSFHIYTIYLVCSNNIWDIIIPGLLFGATNSHIAPFYAMGPALSVYQILAATPFMLLWSCCNIFLFCLHNQKHPDTIAEDKLNKPWRPMATGRLTPAQATRILYLMHPLCFLVALSFGGFTPYVVLTLFHLWYNELGGASNGILKNIQNAVGFCCFYTGPLEVATQHSIMNSNRQGKVWLAILAAIFATTSHAQDFRDMEGDRAAGRRTIPLVFGETPSRVCVVLAVAIWTPMACCFWEVGWKQAAWSVVAGILMTLNLLLYRTRQGDALSWKIWVVWVQGLMMIPFLRAYS
ncbi:UbiA prenyltransferase family [Xylaria grammica]|nr:UbiA prenyltransferase family [Xylaria grammica]